MAGPQGITSGLRSGWGVEGDGGEGVFAFSCLLCCLLPPQTNAGNNTGLFEEALLSLMANVQHASGRSGEGTAK